MQKNSWSNDSVRRFMEIAKTKTPIEEIRRKAKDFALSALEKGWSGPPFDPFQLANLMGVDLFPNERIPDARLVPLGKKDFRIEYNPLQNANRINFSIFHEIGHTFFPDYTEKIRNRETQTSASNWELEMLCNIAAAELLLPYSSFSAIVNSNPVNFDTVKEISTQFNASLESILLKYTEVSDKPCAVVVAKYDTNNNLRVIYSKSSRSFKSDLKKYMIIPDSSKAYECFNPGWHISAKEVWGDFNKAPIIMHAIGLQPLKHTMENRVAMLLTPESIDDRPVHVISTVVRDARQPIGKGIKIIVQVVNSVGAVGRGFGRSLAVKWPETKISIQEWKREKGQFKLGNYKVVQVEKDIYVFQLLAQKGLSSPLSGNTTLSYSALKDGLAQLREIALELGATIHLPRIGAGEARGNWGIIESIIHDELLLHDIEVTLYVQPQGKRKKESTLTLFDQSSFDER